MLEFLRRGPVVTALASVVIAAAACSSSPGEAGRTTSPLSQVLGIVTGGAILESGDVQQVHATLDGNMLTLEYTGGVRVVYEGMIAGDTYKGTFTR